MQPKLILIEQRLTMPFGNLQISAELEKSTIYESSELLPFCLSAQISGLVNFYFMSLFSIVSHEI